MVENLVSTIGKMVEILVWLVIKGHTLVFVMLKCCRKMDILKSSFCAKRVGLNLRRNYND